MKRIKDMKDDLNITDSNFQIFQTKRQKNVLEERQNRTDTHITAAERKPNDSDLEGEWDSNHILPYWEHQRHEVRDAIMHDHPDGA